MSVLDGACVGIDTYGESAPGKVVFETLWFSRWIMLLKTAKISSVIQINIYKGSFAATLIYF